MKKYGMIFASVIFTLLIMFVPNKEVNAALYYYDLNEKYTFNNLGSASKSEIDEVITFLKSIEDTHYVAFAYYTGTNYFQIYIAKKSDYVISKHRFDYSGTNAQISLTPSSATNVISESFTSSNFSNGYNKFLTRYNNNDYSLSGYNFTPTNPILLYCNVDIKIVNLGSYNHILYNDMNLYPGDVIPTYYDYINSKKINISSSFICDSEGKDAEYVTIDYSYYTNVEYTYQYGIKRKFGVDIEWFEISELDNYIYNFNVYNNDIIIYARVLDSSGNEVAINEYTINNDVLPKFDLIISSGLGCPIPNYDGDPQAEIITVDFSNVYLENYKYYYYYDSKSKYEINLTSDNLVYQIVEYLYQFIYFDIYDENDNLIYYSYYAVDSDDRLGFIPDDYDERWNIVYNLTPACDNKGNEIINLQFDFSKITKYVNHYNFDVVINGEHYGAIQYYNLVLDSTNYQDYLNYEIKIYIDKGLFIQDSYSVSNSSSSFDDIYNDTLNNSSSGDINNNESLFNLFINSLNHFKDVIVDIFYDCTYFFDNLSPVLKYFYISVFVLILFGFLIKFIL